MIGVSLNGIAAVSKTAKAYGSDPYNVGSNPTTPAIIVKAPLKGAIFKGETDEYKHYWKAN